MNSNFLHDEPNMIHVPLIIHILNVENFTHKLYNESIQSGSNKTQNKMSFSYLMDLSTNMKLLKIAQLSF